MLRFAHEDYLYALFGILFFILLFILTARWRRQSLKKLGDISLVKKLIPDVSNSKFWVKFLLLTFAFAFLVVGIADPQIGTKLEEVKREGVDVMVALDVSNSMKAEDITPSRIERSKQVISKLIDHLQNDRIGIIAFAGRAFVQLPITTDFGAAKLFLSSIDTDIISTQGTAIGSAIDLAIQSMDMKDKKHKVLIIITDGENHEDDAIDAAKKASKEGIIVHTIGMGSPGGAPIPVYKNGIRVDFLKDKDGQTVVTKLDESALKKIAKAGDGIFVRASNSDDGLKAILQEISQMEKKNYGSKMFTDYEDRFQYFLAAALLLLLLEGITSGKKTKWMQRLNIFNTAKDKKSVPVSSFLIIGLASVLMLLSSGNANAQSENKMIRKGNAEYKDKKYSEAEINFRKALEKNKDSKEAVYNLGDALYKQGKYEEAASQFQQITSGNSSNELKAKAYHNLGNSYLKMKKYEESIAAYKNALKLSPSDNDTKYNLAYAQSMLKQQQQQQQQNKNDKNKDQKQQNKDQQNKDQQNKDQQKQDQQKQDQQKNGDQNKEQNKGNENKEEKDKQGQQPQKISKEDAQRILDALNRKEKDMHKKLDKKESGNSKIDKNW